MIIYANENRIATVMRGKSKRGGGYSWFIKMKWNIHTNIAMKWKGFKKRQKPRAVINQQGDSVTYEIQYQQ